MENIVQQSILQANQARLALGRFFARAGKGFSGSPDPLVRLRLLHQRTWFPLAGLVPLLIFVWGMVGILPSFSDLAGWMMPGSHSLFNTVNDSIEEDKQIKEVAQDIKRLESDLARLTPRGPHLVINTTSNTFRLYNGQKLVREGVCSTGSYTLLTDGKEKRWFFQTPKGVFRIRHKTKNPVWKKPDWAFVEEGLPIPPANHPSRIEYGTLGDYALGLGDGYLIHGTLYKRFLGMPVTHGCVRLGDEDLEAVFKTMPVGAKVYIY